MVDFKKPVQTRDGRKARYLGKLDSDKTNEPFVFAIEESINGPEYVARRNEKGKIGLGMGERNDDIINPVERTVRYVNLCTPYIVSGDLITTRAYPDEVIVPPGFNTLKLTFEDGKLVSSEVIR